MRTTKMFWSCLYLLNYQKYYSERKLLQVKSKKPSQYALTLILQDWIARLNVQETRIKKNRAGRVEILQNKYNIQDPRIKYIYLYKYLLTDTTVTNQ